MVHIPKVSYASLPPSSPNFYCTNPGTTGRQPIGYVVPALLAITPIKLTIDTCNSYYIV